MKTKFFLSPLLGTLFILSLLCTVASASVFNSLLRSFHQNVFVRSLPGSLAFAPEEAIGSYQPPPGPIHYDSLPANNANTPDAPTMAATVENADDDDSKSESKVAMAATESQPDSEE
ncbi:hypothetical protein BDW74DRAFT_172420 [Aspergillus multicolor]|uniref:uncharacterized protein n=1 Tax=Aspergillus multicolor TaxID=41759 RepID=UPI003CCE1E66